MDPRRGPRALLAAQSGMAPEDRAADIEEDDIMEDLDVVHGLLDDYDSDDSDYEVLILAPPPRAHDAHMQLMQEQMMKMQEAAAAREECDSNKWYAMQQQQNQMSLAFQRESESTRLLIGHLFKASRIEQPPVVAPLAFSVPLAHLLVLPRHSPLQDMSKCTVTGHKTLENRDKPLLLKELRKLWEKEDRDLPWEEGDYSPSNTLLVDDSLQSSSQSCICPNTTNIEMTHSFNLVQPHTGIFPQPYSYMNLKDNSLGPGGDLRVYLQSLAAADDVQTYVRSNPFGQPFITDSDPHWDFYSQFAVSGSAPLTSV
ncbi:hypothetical protein C2845_PM09G14540 [Panicum miliaceum]|uniref:Uncharacterized protein n=1 Tax=Panicum miliaceum TaxID=4540 RepID=A0A3L6S2I9_PANMI|nr:hypothetical protein C2845_PM09G14540 [Panicum miliaceum]